MAEAVSLAAIRMRRHRERVASGRVLITIEVDAVDLETALIDGGFLRSHEVDDPRAVRDGLQRAVEVLIQAG
jgi:hypothetical protein